MFKNLKSILVAEDADDQRSFLKTFLDYLGLHSHIAEDGIVATEILQATPVDLIITDFRMPRMDGAALLRWCRSRSMDMPVIFLSSEDHHLEAEDIALKDCCSLLMRHKPFSLELLEIALKVADRRSRDECHFRTFHNAVEEAQARRREALGHKRRFSL